MLFSARYWRKTTRTISSKNSGNTEL